MTASRRKKIPGRTNKDKRQSHAYLGRRRSPRRWRVTPNCSWNAAALRNSRPWSTGFGFFAAMTRRFFAVCSKAINSVILVTYPLASRYMHLSASVMASAIRSVCIPRSETGDRSDKRRRKSARRRDWNGHRGSVRNPIFDLSPDLSPLALLSKKRSKKELT
jgi:hypothetical protein